jgi:uracil-DNA glycosylase family 4
VSDVKRQYLKAMDIPVWVRRTAAPVRDVEPASPVEDAAAPVKATESVVEFSDQDWEGLREAVAGCTRCALSESRTQTVFGVGDRQASLMVIGEAPGAEEDRRGEPFVGRAGKLLDNMLLAIGLKREQVFIANILKCHPPNNRDPKPEEVAACHGYLAKQIEWVAPKAILLVGRIAAQSLFETDAPIGRLRGDVRSINGVPAVATYHPAYLLRQPREKRKAWADLKRIRALLQRD